MLERVVQVSVSDFFVAGKSKRVGKQGKSLLG